MRSTRALRDLFVLLGAVVLVFGAIGVLVGVKMEPAELGTTFLVGAVVVILIAVVLFVGAAILNALIALNRVS